MSVGANDINSSMLSNVFPQSGYKICSKCSVKQDTSNYYIKSYGLQSWCKTCCNLYSREYNRSKRSMLYPGRRALRLKAEYNITENDYNNMLTGQNGLCKICSRESSKKLHIDHCHRTGKVRGLLCSKCNIGLGHFKDDPELLNKAVDYLHGF